MRPWIGNRGLLAGAMLLAAVGVSTARGDIFNGVDWGNNVYDPGTTAGTDGAPTSSAATSPVWTVGSSSGTYTELLAEDYFRLTTDAPPPNDPTRDTATRAYKQTTGISGFTGTFEFRMRAVETNRQSTSAAQFSLIGGGGWVVSISPTKVSVGVDYTPTLPPTQWHTYRLTMEQVGGGGAEPVQQQLRAYVDGTLIYSALRAVPTTDSGFTQMRFGDGSYSTGTNGTSDWDYVRWTTAGAYAPVIPEPATLGLLTLGALAIFARRR